MSNYDADILLWSERQAALLRRATAGEAVNEAPDWSTVIEEIESVGSEQLHAMRSLPVQALTHMRWSRLSGQPGCQAVRKMDEWLDTYLVTSTDGAPITFGYRYRKLNR